MAVKKLGIRITQAYKGIRPCWASLINPASQTRGLFFVFRAIQKIVLISY